MQQVADWLEKLGHGQYAQGFAENDISFSVLHDVTDQHLKEIGVSLGHRLQLLRATAELTSGDKQGFLAWVGYRTLGPFASGRLFGST
jgi:hypothetical protein